MAAHVWTDDELTALCSGVLVHGERDWTAIHDDPNFHALSALDTTQLSSHWEWVVSTGTRIQDALYAEEVGLDQASIAEYLQGYPQPPSESQLSAILESMVARAELVEFGGTYLIPVLVRVQREVEQSGPLTATGVLDFIDQGLITEASRSAVASAEDLVKRARASLARMRAMNGQEDEDSD